ncbi:L,D-transpeptidase family protein [Phenylobacterium montanum]|uniref:L,D-transpeptidase family protein n=1 Tax=Phenylobacterium montanum TaxID=2823693 RepID=A0A975G2I4_9CAUL|nr:L,D-transpeptidase family protein [Caulobacter sp. S6]QUD89511.1 L,D-transpeptidase family protein [Caulobacter sp. S6]
MFGSVMTTLTTGCADCVPDRGKACTVRSSGESECKPQRLIPCLAPPTFRIAVALLPFGLTLTGSARASAAVADRPSLTEVAGEPSPAFLQGLAPAVREAYANDQDRPIWSEAAAAELVASLKTAGRNGIDPRPFLALIARPTGPGPRDRALTLAALAYAKALSSGLADPRRLFPIFTLRLNKTDLVAGLHAALQNSRIGPWLEGLAPQDADYQTLSAAYLDALQHVSDPISGRIPPGPLIRIGDSDPRVSAITTRLMHEGYPTSDESSAQPLGAIPPPSVWTSGLSTALTRYQVDHGLAADGVIGPKTLKLLNETPSDRAQRLAVNLERRRWLDRAAPDTRIDVNTASAGLTFFRSRRLVLTTRVIAGRPRSPTPMLEATFDRVIVNPPWVVPASIARREIEPKGAAYLRRHHMRWRDGHIVQSAGPWAALGQVKFDVRDPYAIYLHDTPQKALFERSQRHLSHACVRVDRAVDFARSLAEASGEGADFNADLVSGKTRVVPLAQSLTVRLLYHTVFVDPAGKVKFRPDVYGWDAEVASALGMEPTPDENVEPAGPTSLGP